MPDNGQAVAGFVCSLVALGLLVISFGLSTIVSLGCAIAGIICSRNGKRKVDAGETPKHRGLAQAGFIIGWVSLGLSILAIIALDRGLRDHGLRGRVDLRPRDRRARRASGRGLTLFSPVRGESLRQAVPHDRRPHAAAARGVAGDGGADGLPPRAGLRRGLRARAEPAQGRLPDGATRCRCSRAPARARSSRPSPTSSARASPPSWPPAASSASAGTSSARPTAPRRSTGRPSGGARSIPPGSTSGCGANPGVELVFTTFSETSTGVVNDIRELTEVAHRHGALIAVDAVSGPRRRAAAAGRVGGGRGRGRLAEGADVAARARRSRARTRPRSSARPQNPGRRYYFDWARTVSGPAQGPARQPVHAGRRASSRRSTSRSG